jgi:uncharacterized membrane protein (UPF0127 family)
VTTPPPRLLLVDGRPVAPLEVAADRRARARGLLGRDEVAGALWLEPVRSVHTFGMRISLDVALCDASGRVLRVIAPLPPRRVTVPRRGVRTVVEAGAGAFARWGLTPGSQLSAGPGERAAPS